MQGANLADIGVTSIQHTAVYSANPPRWKARQGELECPYSLPFMHSDSTTIIGIVAIMGFFHDFLSRPTTYAILAVLVIPVTALAWDRLPPLLPSAKRLLVGKKNPSKITSLECPYSYIRQIYGTHHWAPFVDKLSPSLKTERPAKYHMILEIMDGIHLCLMLVDDVCEISPCTALFLTNIVS